MPIVKIELFPGRSPELKAQIAREITNVLEIIGGISPSATTVMFFDVAPTNWFVAGEPYGPRKQSDER